MAQSEKWGKVANFGIIAKPGGEKTGRMIDYLKHGEAWLKNRVSAKTFEKLDFFRWEAERSEEIETAISTKIEALKREIELQQDEVEKQKLEIEYYSLKLKSRQFTLREKVLACHSNLMSRVASFNPLADTNEKQPVGFGCVRHFFPKLAKKRLAMLTLASHSSAVEMASQVKAASQRANFLHHLLTHTTNFRRYHTEKMNILRNAALSIQRDKEAKLDMQKKEEGKQEAERIRLLRANDMVGYRKLLQEKKDKRLEFLCEKTDEYLRAIGVLVCRRQAEMRVEEAKALERDLARQQDERAEMLGAAPVSASSEVIQRLEWGPDRHCQLAHRSAETIEEQPRMLKGGILKHYQLLGLQWLVSLYNNNLNGILADEMGLGKTIQAIALLCHLMERKGCYGPFLIIVPLSTISNWSNELYKWAPNIRVVIYKGNRIRRKKILKEELHSGLRWNVVLTTYDFVMRDKAVLRKFDWTYIIVDEGHRMKNASCKFSRILQQDYRARNRLLLTGTPLQNSLPELWSLLNFLLPDIFARVEEFEKWFSEPFASYGTQSTAQERQEHQLTSEERLLVINRLHQVLRPFLLRRVKKDVLKQLPDKVERIIRCEISAYQKCVYHNILHEKRAIQKSGSSQNLQNVLMHLRKACAHPYLFENEYYVDMRLIRAAGKFVLLDRMLPKLKATGHRVLIFSQMTELLKIMADFLDFRGYRWMKLVGDTSADERERLIAKFNAEDSPYFCFLLSTRAGGLGINLYTADTVIIFDSDWNPSQDTQAQDRAHRIGQTHEVRVLRLVTNTAVEERILSRATEKKKMESLVIEAGGFNKRTTEKKRKEMLEDLLLNATIDDDAAEIPDDEGVNMLLARTEEEERIFSEMDEARDKEEREFWEAQVEKGAVTGPMPPRLVSMEEVPWTVKRGYMRSTSGVPEEEELEVVPEPRLGRRMRRGRDKVYNDITDEQFDEIYDKDKVDTEKLQDMQERNKQMALERRRQRDMGNMPPLAPPGTGQRRTIADVIKPGSADALLFCGKLQLAMDIVMDASEPVYNYKLCELFRELPSIELYPTYYSSIAEPVSMNEIQAKLSAGEYTDVAEFKNDFDLMIKNAKQFNPRQTRGYLDAVALGKAFKAAMDEIKSELPRRKARRKRKRD